MSSTDQGGGKRRADISSALSPLSSISSSGSKSDDRRDDRPAASSPEPADTSRRLWPHPGRVRSTRAAILTTDRLAATTAAATAAQRREPRSRDFASSLLPLNESAAKRRPRSFIDCAVGAVRQFLDRPGRREAAGRTEAAPDAGPLFNAFRAAGGLSRNPARVLWYFFFDLAFFFMTFFPLPDRKDGVGQMNAA